MVVRFGRYALCRGQRSGEFTPGESVRLDPYDGFVDQALDGVSEGDPLCFVLDDGADLPRNLHDAVMIGGTFDSRTTSVVVQRRPPFGSTSTDWCHNSPTRV